jgi:glycosyltransferase involved in cell wall biosynthesis
MKISLIVPIYNSEKTLRRCIDSILNQTSNNFEVLLINDASTDNSSKLINEFTQKYPDLIYSIELKENQKQGTARNYGIRSARGEYICFVDSDDWIEPKLVEKVHIEALKSNSDLIFFDYFRVNENYQKQSIKSVDINESSTINISIKKTLVLSPGSVISKAYKREFLIKNNLFFPERIFYEDNCFNYIVPPLINSFSYIKSELYNYFENLNGTTSSKKFEVFLDRFKSAEILLKEALSRNYLTIFQKEFEFVITLCHYTSNLKALIYKYNNVSDFLIIDKIKFIRTNFPNFFKNQYFKKKYGLKDRLFYIYFFKLPKLFLMIYKVHRILIHKK